MNHETRNPKRTSSAMPGGLRHKDIDTSSWGVKKWGRARIWNACFLVGWTAFFTFAAIECLQSPFMLVPIVMIGIVGIVSQIVSLVRITIWLRRQ